jgi:DNA-binding MarR family transcriptional regulator
MTDESRSLDVLQRTAWIRFAGVAQGIPAELNSRLLADSGISQFEFLVLNHLNLSDNLAMPMTRLSLLLAASLSRLSHAISRLEKDGRVARSRSADDGRVQIVQLTGAGVELFEAAAPGYYAAVGDLFFDRLDPSDLTELDRIMSKLLAGVDAGGILAPLATEVGGRPGPRRGSRPTPRA